jgi:hypothetical protein
LERRKWSIYIKKMPFFFIELASEYFKAMIRKTSLTLEDLVTWMQVSEFYKLDYDKEEGEFYLFDGYLSVKEFKIYLDEYYRSPEFKEHGTLKKVSYSDALNFNFAFVDQEFYLLLAKIERKLSTYDFSN